MERIVSSLIKGKVHDDLLLVSCEEDYQTCLPLLEKGNYCSILLFLQTYVHPVCKLHIVFLIFAQYPPFNTN